MGEYVPDRWFYEMLAPDLIGLIQREYTPGTNPPFFDAGGIGVGLAICFDVIYDDVIWTSARGGVQVYMFQTNNADFRGTDENLQQLAFARMRAIETGRSVVNLSTVGTSQVIAPDHASAPAAPWTKRARSNSRMCRPNPKARLAAPSRARPAINVRRGPRRAAMKPAGSDATRVPAA